MYYIVCLKHTNKIDSYITLWRDKNAGYCWAMQNAGLYKEPKIGYHDSECNMPVETNTLEQLSISVSLEKNDRLVSVVPNCKAVWDRLGLVWKKGDLIRKNYVQPSAKAR